MRILQTVFLNLLHESMRRFATLSIPVVGILIVTSAWLTSSALQVISKPPLFIAPLLELTDTCVLPGAVSAQVPSSLQSACATGSASALVEQTLAQLPDPAQGPTARHAYEMGYTLPIPLLQLYEKNAHGHWQLQSERIASYVNTLRDTPRKAILYLFGTHFSTHAPLEAELANDEANLAHTQNGVLPVDDYMGSPLYAWSVARTDNSLTTYRTQAIRAIVEEICQEKPETQEKIKGITLLGEVHQLFPNFATNTGYTEPYLISDYSPASVEGFRKFLQKEFGSLHALNTVMRASFANWDEVLPPHQSLLSNDAKLVDKVRHTHLDAYAHGRIPVSGWVFVPDAQAHADSRILVYVDGRQMARLRIDMGRQDVLEAKPEFGHRLVGWQTELDFRDWSSGEHQVDIYLQTPDFSLLHLSKKRVSVSTSQDLRASWNPGFKSLPKSAPASGTIPYWVDLPKENKFYLHNPLAEYWHIFRQKQINDYLLHYKKIFDGTCLAKTPHYLHQIVPHTNPGWDAQKFAIQRSLRPQSDVRLGVSLYGQPGMSAAFMRELRAQGHKHYGVTEFHPLKPLSPEDLRATLDLHRNGGADFFSFFLEPVWQHRPVERAINPFSLSPGNPYKGSDQTFDSMRQLLQE